MCAVSMIYNAFNHFPEREWDWEKINQFQDIIDRLKRLEDEMGIKDCHDPEKVKWVNNIKTYLNDTTVYPVST